MTKKQNKVKQSPEEQLFAKVDELNEIDARLYSIGITKRSSGHSKILKLEHRKSMIDSLQSRKKVIVLEINELNALVEYEKSQKRVIIEQSDPKASVNAKPFATGITDRDDPVNITEEIDQYEQEEPNEPNEPWFQENG